jgi:quercetin dioxygenase-like cupin family protein
LGPLDVHSTRELLSQRSQLATSRPSRGRRAGERIRTAFESVSIRGPSREAQRTGRQELVARHHEGADAQRLCIEMHITELAPGLAPHAPHHHVHEEAVFLLEGTIEVTITGKSTKLNPGSVAYVASNEEHGWKNVGVTRARYVVLALGSEK